MADDEGQLGDVQQQQQPELRERRPRANAPPRWPSESDSEEAPAARESDDDFVVSDEEDPDEEDEEAAEDADQMGDSDASLGSSDYDGAPGYHDAESEEEEESSEPEPEAEVYEEPKREVTAEQAAADLVTVHGMWQFASVVEFLFRFRYHLQLDTMITIDSLADAIVTSPGE